MVDLQTGRSTKLDHKPMQCQWVQGKFVGAYVVAVSGCGVFIWDAKTGKPAGKFPSIHSGGWFAAAPDGKQVAIASSPGPVNVMSIPSGRTVKRLAGHVGGTWQATYSTDGRWLITIGGDKARMHVYDTRSWELVRRVPIGKDVGAIFATDDGGILLGDWEGRGEIRRYAVCPACGDAADLLRQAERQTVRDFSDVERKTYLGR
jgi:WD40 repeat protein